MKTLSVFAGIALIDRNHGLCSLLLNLNGEKLDLPIKAVTFEAGAITKEYVALSALLDLLESFEIANPEPFKICFFSGLKNMPSFWEETESNSIEAGLILRIKECCQRMGIKLQIIGESNLIEINNMKSKKLRKEKRWQD